MNGEQFIAFVCSLDNAQHTFKFDPFAEEPASTSHGAGSWLKLEDSPSTSQAASTTTWPELHHPQPIRTAALQEARRRFEEIAHSEEYQASGSRNINGSRGHPSLLMAACQRRPNPLALPENEQSTLPMHRRAIERPKAKCSRDVPPLIPTYTQQPSIQAPGTRGPKHPNAGSTRVRLQSDINCTQSTSATPQIRTKGAQPTTSTRFRENDSIHFSHRHQQGYDNPGRPQWPPRPSFVLPRRKRTPMPSPRPISPEQSTQGDDIALVPDVDEYSRLSTLINEDDELEYVTDSESREDSPNLRQASESSSDYSDDYHTAWEDFEDRDLEPPDRNPNGDDVVAGNYYSRTSSSESEVSLLSAFSLPGTGDTEHGGYYTQSTSPWASPTLRSLDRKTEAAPPPNLRWLKGMPGWEFSFVMAASKARRSSGRPVW